MGTADIEEREREKQRREREKMIVERKIVTEKENGNDAKEKGGQS